MRMLKARTAVNSFRFSVNGYGLGTQELPDADRSLFTENSGYRFRISGDST
jgi:hypothetical protein